RRAKRARTQARASFRPSLEQLETRAVPAVIANFVEYSDWGSGFVGGVTLTNNTSQAVNGWDLQFDFAATITQIWNAQIVRQGNGHCELRDAGYDAFIAPGQSVNFGFIGAPGHVTAAPANYVLNGASLGGNTPPTIIISPSASLSASGTTANLN